MTFYNLLAKLEQENRAGVLCTIIRSQGSTPRHSTSKMLVYSDGSIAGTVGGGEMEHRVVQEALQSLQEGKPRLLSYNMTDPSRGDPGVCGGQVEIFVEPIMPKPNLLLIGSGHVGKSVAHLADWLGFHVIVSDDRREFCSPDAIPEGKAFFPVSPSELLDQIEITPWTYVVMTTRGVTVDLGYLPGLLGSPAAYIGVIGSRRRWQTTRKELIAQGIPPEKIDWIHSPIGLELNAETPNEIAVSIMAEILMIHLGGSGKTMKMDHAIASGDSGNNG
jgi:xanthine dehydrogenase accessory factor